MCTVLQREITVPSLAQKIGLGGSALFIPVAIGVGVSVVDGDPLPAIYWFSAAAISAVIAVFLWDEVLTLAPKWRVVITVVAVMLTFVCVWRGDNWVASKAEARAKKEMELQARESASGRKPTVPVKTNSPSVENVLPKPHLSVQCFLPEDLSPCEVKCSVYNPHDTAMSNVSIGFNGMYPYQTHLAADTEAHMSIKKQETLPLPMAGGYIDQNILAFSVEVPLIPANTSLAFAVWSTSEDNQRACLYLKTTILSEQRRKIEKLISITKNKHLSADAIASVQVKTSSLFKPGNVVSADGKKEVEFITGPEKRMNQTFSKLYRQMGASLDGKSCLIPIIAVEHSDGTFGYITYPSSIMTWNMNLKKTEIGLETDTTPPKTYSCAEIPTPRPAP